jgi:type IV secretion system protein TrbE
MEAADAVKDTLGLDSFTVFEIEELMNLAPKYGLPVLLYLFRRLERSLHGQPAAIFLDEAWIMLGHAVFRDKIREWLKVMPKANCVVLICRAECGAREPYESTRRSLAFDDLFVR